MGKSNSRNRSQERESQGSLTAQVVRQALPRLSPLMTEIQDLRRAVDPLEVARDLFQQVAQIGVTDQPARPMPGRKRVSPKIRFDAPASTLVCIRRHTRKEVLFAKKKTGKGGRSKKHFNLYSKVRCS